MQHPSFGVAIPPQFLPLFLVSGLNLPVQSLDPSPPPPPLDSHPAKTCTQQTKQKAIYADFEHSPDFSGATDVIGDTLWCATPIAQASHIPRL